MEFPTLYGKASNDKIKEWSISVIHDTINNIAIIQILNGYIDGKKAKSQREIKSGKNIGKKNETTILQQAIAEATKKWNDKKEKEAYQQNNNFNTNASVNTNANIGENSNFKMFPMLAHKFEIIPTSKRNVDITFPCHIQPKLDGLRCIAFIDKNTNNIILQSRVGKFFHNLNHIRNDVNNMIKHIHSYHNESENNKNTYSYYLDGELYTNKLPFEEITGICRKEKLNDVFKEKQTLIQYHVYDFYNKNQPSTPFHIRNKIIKSFNINKKTSSIQHVDTEMCNSRNDVKQFHSKYISNGFEGIMLRNSNSPYTLKNRSRNLQKYKEFSDDEFNIVGFHEGQGEDRETIIWECAYTDTEGNIKTFSVRPKGTREHRNYLFINANKNFSQFFNKKLTVRYQELTKDGCPRFPVGIDLRCDI